MKKLLFKIFPCFFNKERSISTYCDVTELWDIKTELSDLEIEVVRQVGYERSSRENVTEYLRTLHLDPYLCTIADVHSDNMAFDNKLSHDGFAQRNRNAIDYCQAKWFGEIVAYGYSTARGVVSSWTSSPGHAYIMFSPKATHYGISIVKSESGRNYFTMLFSERKI